ncbi:MAG TPA: sigma-70 family RNA polymerase sigma factor [Solirubrobacteraceae bacterium]|jgi:RNA polymerase sigma factor (sigma-70 family)|nr:sigma-70 family RNA polymerase sigma factor [Solirubrobacteraceae bacterium]
MEVSALRYSGGIGLHGRSPLLRLQSDERLISLTRRGNAAAFEVLVSRYHTRLLAFCRHLLGSREDAEDVLQEVLAAAFNAILADDRAINVRPWLYRIARNRSLNHLRRIQAIGVDSMDIHFSENGATTADKVHDREQFRLLVGDIHELPETQRTALVLREMDALSYEQIAEAMDTTVPGVKSLLVRARISLADAAEARLLSCEEVRIELAEVAEGLRKRPTPLVRRHLRSCHRCSSFQGQLKHTNKALAALLPIGPLALLRKLAIVHLSHSAGGSGATAASATGATGAAAGPAAAVAGTAGSTAMFGSAGGMISAGAGAIATKAAAGLAAAAIVTAGAVEASHVVHHSAPVAAAVVQPIGAEPTRVASAPPKHATLTAIERPARKHRHKSVSKVAAQAKHATSATPSASTAKTDPSAPKKKKTPAGRTQAQADPTVLSSASPTPTATPTGTADTSGSSGSSAPPSSTSSGTTGTTGPSGTTSTTPSSSGSTTTTGSTSSTGSSDGTTSGSSAGTTTDPSAATGTTGATGTSAGATDGSGTPSAPLF